MSDYDIRAQIVDELRKKSAAYGYYTWRFKFAINCDTKTIRRELVRMERDGLVIADRSHSNSTRWWLTDGEGVR